MGWYTHAPGAPASAVCIKPRMVQTICLALMGPRGWLFCQLWDHPGVAAGFPVARPPYCPNKLPGSVGVWPDALADDFRTHASFQGAAGRLRVSGVVPLKGNARDRSRRGETVEPLSDRVRIRRASVTRVNT